MSAERSFLNRWRGGVIALLVLTAAACNSSAHEASPTSLQGDAPPASTAETDASRAETTEAGTAAGDAEDSTPESASTDTLRPADDGAARVALQSAATALAGARGFRTSTSAGQVLRIPAIGVNSSSLIDPDRPTSVIEVAANGDSHTFIDLGAILGPLFSANPEAAAAVDTAAVELWTSADRIVIDATRYQSIVDLNPDANLGPFAPGIGVIDLQTLGDNGEDALVTALIGSPVADPVVLASRLSDVLGGIEQDPDQPNTFRATASYADVVTAQGGDFQAAARGAAVGIAQALKLDVDQIADFYVRLYETTRAQVDVTIGADGALRSVEYTVDLSSAFVQLFDAESGVDVPGLSDSDRDEAKDAFAGTRWVISGRSVFELDDSLVVTPPVGDFEDRTDIAAEYLAEVVPD